MPREATDMEDPALGSNVAKPESADSYVFEQKDTNSQENEFTDSSSSFSSAYSSDMIEVSSSHSYHSLDYNSVSGTSSIHSIALNDVVRESCINEDQDLAQPYSSLLQDSDGDSHHSDIQDSSSNLSQSSLAQFSDSSSRYLKPSPVLESKELDRFTPDLEYSLDESNSEGAVSCNFRDLYSEDDDESIFGEQVDILPPFVGQISHEGLSSGGSLSTAVQEILVINDEEQIDTTEYAEQNEQFLENHLLGPILPEFSLESAEQVEQPLDRIPVGAIQREELSKAIENVEQPLESRFLGSIQEEELTNAMESVEQPLESRFPGSIQEEESTSAMELEDEPDGMLEAEVYIEEETLTDECNFLLIQGQTAEEILRDEYDMSHVKDLDTEFHEMVDDEYSNFPFGNRGFDGHFQNQNLSGNGTSDAELSDVNVYPKDDISHDECDTAPVDAFDAEIQTAEEVSDTEYSISPVESQESEVHAVERHHEDEFDIPDEAQDVEVYAEDDISLDEFDTTHVDSVNAENHGDREIVADKYDALDVKVFDEERILVSRSNEPSEPGYDAAESTFTENCYRKSAEEFSTEAAFSSRISPLRQSFYSDSLSPEIPNISECTVVSSRSIENQAKEELDGREVSQADAIEVDSDDCYDFDIGDYYMNSDRSASLATSVERIAAVESHVESSHVDNERRQPIVESLQSTLDALKSVHRESMEVKDHLSTNPRYSQDENFDVEDLDDCINQMKKEFAELEDLHDQISNVNAIIGLGQEIQPDSRYSSGAEPNSGNTRKSRYSSSADSCESHHSNVLNRISKHNVREAPLPRIPSSSELGQAVSNDLQSEYSDERKATSQMIVMQKNSTRTPLSVKLQDELPPVPLTKRDSASRHRSGMEYDKIAPSSVFSSETNASGSTDAPRGNVFFQNRPESVPKALRTLGIIPSIPRQKPMAVEDVVDYDSDDSLLGISKKGLPSDSTKALKTLGIISTEISAPPSTPIPPIPTYQKPLSETSTINTTSEKALKTLGIVHDSTETKNMKRRSVVVHSSSSMTASSSYVDNQRQLPLWSRRKSSVDKISIGSGSSYPLQPASAGRLSLDQLDLNEPSRSKVKALKLLGVVDPTVMRRLSSGDSTSSGQATRMSLLLESSKLQSISEKSQPTGEVVGSINNANVVGHIAMSIPTLLGRRTKQRFFMLSPTRLLYFKSNAVDSKLLGSIQIDGMTLITFPKSQRDKHVMVLSRVGEQGLKGNEIMLVFDNIEKMKGWERGIEVSVRMSQTLAAMPPSPPRLTDSAEQHWKGMLVKRSSDMEENKHMRAQPATPPESPMVIKSLLNNHASNRLSTLSGIGDQEAALDLLHAMDQLEIDLNSE